MSVRGGLGRLWLGLGLLSWAAAAVPTDNPVASFYQGDEGYPAWTDALAWSRVIDMSAYAQGRNAFERFEAARDELAARGGGVLYYPAGDYDFADAPADGPGGRGLMLRSGVVIRGQAPVGRPLAREGQLPLPTRFHFAARPRAGGQVPRDWNLIGLRPEPGQGVSAVTNVGICWVELDGATVFFGFESNWGATWREAGSWLSAQAKETWAARRPDGTHPKDAFSGGPAEGRGGRYLGAGRGRLVFGCAVRDACVLDDGTDHGAGPDSFFTDRYGARVGVYGSRVAVLNNLLPKPTKAFAYRQRTLARKVEAQPVERRILFDPGMTMGLDVNKELLGLVREDGRCRGYREEGVLVRDNWVWNHGHKGYNLAGGWAVIERNHNERTFLASGDDVYGLGGDWTLTMNGYLVSNATDDNLARAFDLAGSNLWVEGNTYNNTGSSPGNDGEGILCQLHGGTHVQSWALTHNRGTGRPGYMGAWDVDCLGLLMAWNTCSSWLGAAAFERNRLADCAFVANNPRGQPDRANPPRQLVATADQRVWPLLDEAPGSVRAPGDVRAEAYGDDGVRVSWRDAADNEIGFRVDRQLDGGKWQPIAYRPPHREGAAENPQVWIDFLAPRGRSARYRVVAVNTADDDTGASPPSSTVAR